MNMQMAKLKGFKQKLEQDAHNRQFHRDYIAALVQLQRQGVWAVNGVAIEDQLAQFRKEQRA